MPQALLLSVALEQREHRPLKHHLGVEYTFLQANEHRLSARFGLLSNYMEDRSALTNLEEKYNFNELSRRLAFGVGALLFDRVQVDYVLVKRNELLDNNSFISIGYRF